MYKKNNAHLSNKIIKLFPKLHSEKVAPAGQLSESKLELKLSNRNKPEITNDKHQMTNKFQITISNDQNIQRGCTVSLPKLLSAGDYVIWHKCWYHPFGILNFGFCYLFDICVLLFDFFLVAKT